MEGKKLDMMDVDHFLLRAMNNPETFRSKLFYADMFRNAYIASLIRYEYEKWCSSQEVVGENLFRIVDIPCGKAPILSFIRDIITDDSAIEMFCVDCNFKQLSFIKNFYADISTNLHLVKNVSITNMHNNWYIPTTEINIFMSLIGPENLIRHKSELRNLMIDVYRKSSNDAICILALSVSRSDKLTDSYTHSIEFTIEEMQKCICDSDWRIKRMFGYRMRPENYEEFIAMSKKANSALVSAINDAFSFIPYEILSPIVAMCDKNLKVSSEVLLILDK